jgi:hypothetical protein
LIAVVIWLSAVASLLIEFTGEVAGRVRRGSRDFAVIPQRGDGLGEGVPR